MSDPTTTTVARSRARRTLRAVIAMVSFTVPVAVLAWAVRSQSETVLGLDQRVVVTASNLTRDHGLTPVALGVQTVMHPLPVHVVGTIAVLVAWLVLRMPARALWGFCTMMIGWGAGEAAKLLVQRVRPVLDDPLSQPGGYSFPSGHALNTTLVVSTVLVLLWPAMSATSRWITLTAGMLVIVAVDLDRVLLGVHFPSDVVAGTLLGAGITFSSWLAFVQPASPPSPPASSSRS